MSPTVTPTISAILQLDRRQIEMADSTRNGNELVEGLDSPILIVVEVCRVITSSHAITRLLLDDGELCIQALLHPKPWQELLLFAHDKGLTSPGDDEESWLLGRRIALVEFSVETRQEPDISSGSIFLLVKDLEMVEEEPLHLPWAEKKTRLEVLPAEKSKFSINQLRDKVSPPQSPQLEGELDARHTLIYIPGGQSSAKLEMASSSNSYPREIMGRQKKSQPITTSSNDDSDDSFETMRVDLKRVANQQQKILSHRALNIYPIAVPRPRSNLPLRHLPTRLSSAASPRPSFFPIIPEAPLHLTPLGKITTGMLPYQQNWSIATLCVIVSVTPVEPAHLPPHRQRIARIAHPSCPGRKRVHLTVFLDPEEFNPAPGSIVMLVGVKNHRFDGGSLKKYASDRPPHGERWWRIDPDREVQMSSNDGKKKRLSALPWCKDECENIRSWWTAEPKEPEDG